MAEERGADLSDLTRRLDELEAKDAIVTQLYRYARGVDRGDIEVLKSVYHPEALDLHGGTFAGPADEFAERIVEHMSVCLTNRHVITNALVELDGERAFVESQFLSTHRVPVEGDDAIDLYAEGRYLDVFTRQDGRWAILHRVIVHEKSLAYPAKSSEANPETPYGLRASTRDDDPSYLGYGLLDYWARYDHGSPVDRVVQKHRDLVD